MIAFSPVAITGWSGWIGTVNLLCSQEKLARPDCENWLSDWDLMRFPREPLETVRHNLLPERTMRCSPEKEKAHCKAGYVLEAGFCQQQCSSRRYGAILFKKDARGGGWRREGRRPCAGKLWAIGYDPRTDRFRYPEEVSGPAEEEYLLLREECRVVRETDYNSFLAVRLNGRCYLGLRRQSVSAIATLLDETGFAYFAGLDRKRSRSSRRMEGCEARGREIFSCLGFFLVPKIWGG